MGRATESCTEIDKAEQMKFADEYCTALATEILSRTSDEELAAIP